MKKTAVLLALLFCISGWLSPFLLPVNSVRQDEDAVFRLPSTLMTIDGEAFAGTAVQNVILPELLTTIGERAFADNRTLKTVSIPDSVLYIDDLAFEGAEDLKILAAKDSYAARWAKEHGFLIVQTENARTYAEKIGKLLKDGTFIALSFQCIYPGSLLRPRRRTQRAGRTMRPQERPELYPINYRFP